jgi:hypothetical protein
MTPAQQQALAAARARIAQQASAAPSRMEAVVRGFGQGGTANFADEIASAIQAGTGSRSYDQNLAMNRAQDRVLQAQRPNAWMGGEMLGQGIQQVASAVAFPQSRLLNPATAGQLGLNSGLWGMLSGFGRGEGGFENRMKTAAQDGAMQGAMGYGGGVILNKILPKEAPAAQTFIDNYTANKEALRAKTIAGVDVVKGIRDIMAQRGGQAYADAAPLPPELLSMRNPDLYSLDTMRSRLGGTPYDGDIRAALTQIIGDRVPVDFRKDYATAMKLDKIDNALQKSGGNPVVAQRLVRNMVSDKNARGWTKQEIDAANKAGKEGWISGLLNGKTASIVTTAVGAGTGNASGVASGVGLGAARAAIGDNVMTKIDRFRNVVAGKTRPDSFVERAATPIRKGGKAAWGALSGLTKMF